MPNFSFTPGKADNRKLPEGLPLVSMAILFAPLNAGLRGNSVARRVRMRSVRNNDSTGGKEIEFRPIWLFVSTKTVLYYWGYVPD